MGIFNRILGNHDDDTSLRQQESEVLQALNAANREKDQAVRRLAAALDAATQPMLLADEQHVVVHANAAAIKLLRENERDLRAALPSLAVEALVGSKLEACYPSSVLQRAVFDTLAAPRTDSFVHGNHHCRLTVSPVLDASRRRIGTLVEWQDCSEQKRSQAEQQERQQSAAADHATLVRLQKAVDGVSVNIMLAGADGNIVYINPAMAAMFRNAQAEMRKQFPEFSVDHLIGKSMDLFHRNPHQQGSLLQGLKAPHRAQIRIGGNSFSLVATPLFDSNGSRLGTAVEWHDRSDEVLFDRLLSETLEAAGKGDISKRIDVSRLNGNSKAQASNINSLMAGFEQLINDLTVSLDALANGKLTRKLTQDYQGSFATVKNAINATVDKLVGVVSDIQSSAVGVKSGAVEINNSNINLSSRTEQQAASLEETSAAMEEITTTVQQNAANAIQANNMARAARETAENGGQVVSKAVAAMQAISESSNKINEIIGVIDEIAFQTNLLALNAAVEAARAGDQGRGFAVVADEVRNLAGRSAKAAKEIKDLIKDSGEKVREGSNLVNKSGQTLDEIVMAVKKVNDIVAEISTASDEQAAGLDEIKRAVNEMDTMTQQNAALVEQAATAGRALDNQASMLETMIAFFDTGLPQAAMQREPAPRTAMPATTRVASSAPAKRSVLKTPAAKASRPMPARPATAAKAATKAAAKPAARPVVPPRHDDEDKNWAEF